MPRVTWVCLLCALSLLASPALPQEAVTKGTAPPVPEGVKFCPDLTYCKIEDRAEPSWFIPLGLSLTYCKINRALQLDLAYPATRKGPFPAPPAPRKARRPAAEVSCTAGSERLAVSSNTPGNGQIFAGD